MGTEQNKYYIVCRNITEVFRAEKSLKKGGIKCMTVPSPPKEAGPCTTVLEIGYSDIKKSIQILKASYIEILKIIKAKPAHIVLKQKIMESIKNKEFREALIRVTEGHSPTLSDIKVLLEATEENQKVLWQTADEVRQKTVGNIIDIRAALEFSNYCRRDCAYCGLRSKNRNLSRYRMTEREICDNAVKIASMGIKTIILQSGEDPWYTRDRIVSIIKTIKSETGMRITLSLGEREPEEYQCFKNAGASNYLLKIETTDKKLYRLLHPGYHMEGREHHVRLIKKSGLITGSGNIIGLPGQSIENIAHDIIWLRQEGIHMIGIGPFVPAPDTPLEKNTPGAVDLSLNCIAVSRLVCQNSYIPSTTALATIQKEAQLQGLASGANTVMLIMTPPQYIGKYRIYGNKFAVDLDWALSMVKSLGRKKPQAINNTTKTCEVAGFEYHTKK